MRLSFAFLALLLISLYAKSQDKPSLFSKNGVYPPNQYFTCSLKPTIFHLNEYCKNLLPCAGGKRKKIKDSAHLQPCRECAWPEQIDSAFVDIKLLIRKNYPNEIIDLLGTGTIITNPGRAYNRNGFEVSFPTKETVGMNDFVAGILFRNNENSIPFKKSYLLSSKFYKQLGLNFEGCKADTINASRPFERGGHPPQQPIIIYYRGCTKVNPIKNYEDTSKYFYELSFNPVSGDLGADLQSVFLRLRRKEDGD